jgi:hypothetical protein
MVSFEQKLLEAKDWIKVRASTDGKQSFLAWQGSIFAFTEGEPKKHLFNILGMSVARCIPQSEGWDFTSRELTFYLDPETGEKLEKWQNPWTEEELTVVHVANSPVQGHFSRPMPALVGKESITYKFDLFPYYENPLADDPKFAPYSPQPMYQASELFKLTVPTQDLQDPSLTSVSQVLLAWDRIGPWLPWMKMGERKGHLIYSAWGEKVNGVTELFPLIQTEINTRVPLFKNAASSLLEEEDMSSWLYFKQHFEAYLKGEIFPICQ